MGVHPIKTLTPMVQKRYQYYARDYQNKVTYIAWTEWFNVHKIERAKKQPATGLPQEFRTIPG